MRHSAQLPLPYGSLTRVAAPFLGGRPRQLTTLLSGPGKQSRSVDAERVFVGEEVGGADGCDLVGEGEAVEAGVNEEQVVEV